MVSLSFRCQTITIMSANVIVTLTHELLTSYTQNTLQVIRTILAVERNYG